MSLSVEQFQQLLTQENAFIIDTRDEASFLEGFIPSSIHFKPEIIHQAAALGLLAFEQPLLFIGADDNEKIAMAYFEKLGFSNNYVPPARNSVYGSISNDKNSYSSRTTDYKTKSPSRTY